MAYSDSGFKLLLNGSGFEHILLICADVEKYSPDFIPSHIKSICKMRAKYKSQTLCALFSPRGLEDTFLLYEFP